MKKQSLIALSLLTSIAVLTGCSQSDMEKQIQPKKNNEETQTQQQQPIEMIGENEGGEVEKTTEQLIQEKFDEKEQEIEALTEEVQYYRTFVKDFTSTFSSDEMQKFVDKEWSYHLTINNINFPKSGVLELTSPSFDLVISEKRVPYSVIPDSMSEKGRIPNGLATIIQFSGDAKPETEEEIEDKASFITYSFKDVPSGTIIGMKIPAELQEELSLDSMDLEIHIQ